MGFLSCQCENRSVANSYEHIRTDPSDSLCAGQPLWQIWNEELGFSYQTLNNAYAACTAALAVACVLFIPLALRFGRRPVYLFTGLLMLCTSIWQAVMKHTSDLYGYSVVTGFASAINEAIFQVTVGVTSLTVEWR